MSISHISEVLPAVVPAHAGRRSLQELIEEFEANESLENPDAVVPLKQLLFLNEGTLAIPGLQGPFAFTGWSKRQMAALVGVRWDRWFARMEPEDQAAEVNKRLWSSGESLRIRTSRVAVNGNGAEGLVRALVSPTFSPLPDSQLLGLLKEALEPVEPELRVIRSDVTDRSATYVIGVGRAFRPGDDHEVGDIWGGLCIRNSGVGFAAAMIVANFTRLICKNGMTAPLPDAVLFRRAHRAFDLQKVRETLVERFRELPGKLANAARALLASRASRTDDPRPAFLEVLRSAHLPRKFLPELEQAYEAEPGLKGSAFGISQAATRAAQGMTPEDRFALEQAAGEYVANLSRTVH